MEIKHTLNDGILVIDLKGDLKDKVMYKMKPFIMEVVNNDFKKIVLNMQDVKSVDVSWCDYLCKMYKVMNNYGRRLVITNCPDVISEKDYTGKVKKIYPLFNSIEAARRHLNPGVVKDEIVSSSTAFGSETPRNDEVKKAARNDGKDGNK
ncbi:MAG: anti-sigma factor antagonist [Candidatus Omnitrophica bacterium]|nr:anti-sigma factor antagonist [Candidatus Omnitrophota bacterium]